MRREDKTIKLFMTFAVVRGSGKVTKNFSRIIEPAQ
jgi:hypothetical protein